MGATYPLNGSAVESHEERIQRLEEDSQQISTLVAKYGEQLKFLSEKIEDLPDRLEEKIAPTLDSVKSHTKKIQCLAEEVDALSKDKKERQKRWGFLNKIIMAAILAISGGLGVKLLELLLK